MKHLPNTWNQSQYKYNILARLALLEGGVSTLIKKKRALIDHLIAQGAREPTIRKWLVIERGAKQEIPFSVLVSIRDFFNHKYKTTSSSDDLPEEQVELIETEDLFFAGQLRILPSR